MPTPMKEVPPLAAIMVVEEQCSGASSSANASNSNEAWTCSCNMQWPSTQKRCGNTKCNKWKGGKRDGFIVHRPNVPPSTANAPTITTTKQRPQDPSTVTAVQQQANTIDCWTCDNCQNIVKANKVRCGKCHHWKGGKRTTVKKTTAKNDDSGNDNSGGSLLPSSSSSGAAAVGNNGGGETANNNKASYPFDITQDWTCNNCSITLPGRQTRCGKCHKWRGGKRQGGWTLKAKSTRGGQEEEDDGIDRTVDWTCCEAVLPARQTRCGKCHKWRGGKRVFAGNNGGDSKKSKNESNKKAKVVPSDNGLKENGNQMEAPSVHQHHSLANDKTDNTIVFEYPMPFAPAAAAPLYHPMPAISSTAGYLPLPSPITKTAEVCMNSVEI